MGRTQCTRPLFFILALGDTLRRVREHVLLFFTGRQRTEILHNALYNPRLVLLKNSRFVTCFTVLLFFIAQFVTFLVPCTQGQADRPRDRQKRLRGLQ